MAPPLITTLGGASTRGFGQGGGSAFVMPSGIIIPFTGASTPSGWADFSSANDKAIVGAGASYSAGSTGGSSSFSTAVSLSNTGSHSGSQAFMTADGPDNNAPGGNYSAGAHNHTLTVSGSGDPQYRKYKLIKASADASAVPAGGVILGNTTLTGCSNIDSGNNGLMYGGSAVGNGGSNTVAMNGSTSNSGSHNHAINRFSSDSEGGNRKPRGVSAGAHSHTSSCNLTWNPKHYILTAWSNAAADFSFEGSGIGMWESATPPDGWYICNGANGTPDLRDYFVKIGSTATHGTSAGDNSNAFNSGSAGNTVNHSHAGSNVNDAQGDGRHLSYSWTHTHNFGGGSISQLPPYYGLYFIQKAA